MLLSIAVLPLAAVSAGGPLRALLQDEPSAEQEQARLAEGWRRQDFEWIPPDEVANLDQGLWKCGGEWMSLERANAYHARLDTWWRIPGEHTVLYTTLSRHDAETALAGIEDAHADLVRLFGVEPPAKPLVVALDSREQYLAFTGGDVEKGEPGRSFFGLHLLHGAYYADNWFDEAGRSMRAGVAYWAIGDAKEGSFGTLWIRHALGQAFAEGLDASPEALAERSELLAKDRDVGFDWALRFWEEKVLPDWLRQGAAVYVERYYVDDVAAADGDPLWARKWSVQNIESRGGFEGVGRVVSGRLRIDQPEESAKWINQCGLLVAFLLDGEDKTVTKAHGKVIDALAKFAKDPDKSRKGLEKAVEGLEKALEKQEKKLREFAGL